MFVSCFLAQIEGITDCVDIMFGSCSCDQTLYIS